MTLYNKKEVNEVLEIAKTQLSDHSDKVTKDYLEYIKRFTNEPPTKEIHGLVQNELKLSLELIKKFVLVNYPQDLPYVSGYSAKPDVSNTIHFELLNCLTSKYKKCEEAYQNFRLTHFPDELL